MGMIQIYSEEIKTLQREKNKLQEEIYFLREMLEYKTLGTPETLQNRKGIGQHIFVESETSIKYNYLYTGIE